MKISYNWLKDYIKIDKSPDEVAKILTSIGLEVESIENFETVKGGLNGFVIGHVIHKEKHPDADRLSLTKVDIGYNKVLDIVCGAPNVAEGQKVVVATVGTVIYGKEGSFEIKKSKIRGAVSEGMICAEDEMGLGESHDGILVLDNKAVPGTLANKYFNIQSDIVFEIGLTPNRIDAASHIGVARDLVAYLKQSENVKFEKPDVDNQLQTSNLKPQTFLPFEVVVENQEACPRYSGICITNVKVEDSPQWLQNRLKAIGLRPINNIVDITNYVLHETGQPLHAFDYEMITGNKVIIKTLAENTPFTTLDGNERKLSANDLMICNNAEGMCIAGVFGGLKSGVTEKTKNIFLESAYFNPAFIRRTSKTHGLYTDSSFRFERGADPENTVYALKRACKYILELTGGEIASELIDIYPVKAVRNNINVNINNIERSIGKKIPTESIVKILESLEIKILEKKHDDLVLEIPSFKVDVTREADIVEEILRIYGYNNIEIPTRLNSSISHFPIVDKDKIQNQVSDYLTSNGFNEIMCNSLSNSSYYESDNHSLVKILNPLSAELSAMRQTLLFGGLETIANNINRKNSDLSLYEFGYCYFNKSSDSKKLTDRYFETHHLSIFTTGSKQLSNWITKDEKADFYYLKSMCENILRKAGVKRGLEINEIQNSQSKYGVEYFLNKTKILSISAIGSDLLKKFDIKQEVYYAEFDWYKILEIIAIKEVKCEELPKYPEVKRDLALLINKEVTFEQIRKLALETERKLLKSVSLFDVYEGEKIGNDKKSYAVSFTLRDDSKTLTDEEIEKIMTQLIKSYENKLDAKLR
ncbi:MAG: phenylalanine--tRNA ligase subunit beta [Bacteroidetes bacterium GWA2_31_9]|nr:MAG: phenylalanine--tRNA ligase subunit beta [Bacteroidetes bacterium GWA2_31_9]